MQAALAQMRQNEADIGNILDMDSDDDMAGAPPARAQPKRQNRTNDTMAE